MRSDAKLRARADQTKKGYNRESMDVHGTRERVGSAGVDQLERLVVVGVVIDVDLSTYVRHSRRAAW